MKVKVDLVVVNLGLNVVQNQGELVGGEGTGHVNLGFVLGIVGNGQKSLVIGEEALLQVQHEHMIGFECGGRLPTSARQAVKPQQGHQEIDQGFHTTVGQILWENPFHAREAILRQGAKVINQGTKGRELRIREKEEEKRTDVITIEGAREG